MIKYQRKAGVVEAYQWQGYENGQEEEQLIRYFRDQPRRLVASCSLCKKKLAFHGQILTQEEKITVCPGDYIINSEIAGIYPVKPSIFNELYEVVNDTMFVEVIEENKELLQRLAQGEDNG